MWIKKDLDVRDMGSCSRTIGPDFWVFLTIKLVTQCNCTLPQLQDVCGCRQSNERYTQQQAWLKQWGAYSKQTFWFPTPWLHITEDKRRARAVNDLSVTYWNFWLLLGRSCWINVLLSSSWLQLNYILGFLEGAKVHGCKEGRTKQVLCNRKEWIILCLLSCFHNCWKPNL